MKDDKSDDEGDTVSKTSWEYWAKVAGQDAITALRAVFDPKSQRFACCGEDAVLAYLDVWLPPELHRPRDVDGRDGREQDAELRLRRQRSSVLGNDGRYALQLGGMSRAWTVEGRARVHGTWHYEEMRPQARQT